MSRTVSVPERRVIAVVEASRPALTFFGRLGAGAIIANLALVFYVARGFLQLSEEAGLIVLCILVAAGYTAYVVCVEPRFKRTFQRVRPFDVVEFAVIVLIFCAGAYLLCAASAEIPLSRDVVASALLALLVGASTGQFAQVVLGCLRDLLVSFPRGFDRAELGRAALLVATALAALAWGLGRANTVPPHLIAGLLLAGVSIGVCAGVAFDARRIAQTSMRLRAISVVFPKEGRKSRRANRLSDKHRGEKASIESRLFNGDVNSASVLIQATDLPPRERYILSVTCAYVSGDYQRVLKMCQPEAYGDVDVASSERVLSLVANAYFELGDFAEAIQTLEKAVISFPNNQFLQVNLALFYLELDRPENALKAARSAYEFDCASTDTDGPHPTCPLIRAAYALASDEAADSHTRAEHLGERLGMVRDARNDFRGYYAAYLNDAAAQRDGQGWRTMLFLVTTLVHFLVRKGDKKSLDEAEDLLRCGERIAPLDAKLRVEIGRYFERRARHVRRESLGALRSRWFEFKAWWYERSGRGMTLRSPIIPEVRY
jgi:tetratricopeptide (TPR) repeat protein